MTTKTFRHSFYPWHKDPVRNVEVKLSVEEIEEAGIREVLQTPGAALGSWSLLDALLAKCNEFKFVEPLGQAREVKVVLSGLFGRFVARAYLERYLGLVYFTHLGKSKLKLGRRLRVRVERRPGHLGDLPDWVACAGNLTQLTVAEAKGSHAYSGPESAITQARKQIDRVHVFGGRGQLPVKQVAVATRWGMLKDGPSEPWISVHDPEEEGEDYTEEEVDAALLGVARLHMGNLLGGLGHNELAGELRTVAQGRTAAQEYPAAGPTRQLLGAAGETGNRLRDAGAEAIGDAVIGGIVTRAGALDDRVPGDTDVSVLARLDLRPVFVGVTEEAVRAAIEGDTQFFRERGSQSMVASSTESLPRLDMAGEVVRLDRTDG